MILRCVFIQRKENYEGEFAPELLVAWDEYLIDENPDGFQDEVEASLFQVKEEIQGHTIVDIEIPQDEIRNRCLNQNSAIKGKIVKNTDVHTEHCCKTCGCKYGQETTECSVSTGEKKQSFPCGKTGVCGDHDY